MKKIGILNQNISNLVAGMGHGQRLMIVDAGFPISGESRRIDLSLICGIPSFMETLRAIFKELFVESVIIADELPKENPELYNQLEVFLDNISMTTISHDELKKQSSHSSGIIRTGECSPFANIVLISGVTF